MEKNQNRSGGPKTEDGKARSSQNSLSHGMCQERFMLLPGESQEQYDALRQGLRKQYDTAEPLVAELVETLAECNWIQRRCTQNICKLQLQLAEAEAANDDARIDRLERRLNNAFRYKTTAENSFQRALRALEKFRAVRQKEQVTKERLEIREHQVIYGIAYNAVRLGCPMPEIKPRKNELHTS